MLQEASRIKAQCHANRYDPNNLHDIAGLLAQLAERVIVIQACLTALSTPAKPAPPTPVEDLEAVKELAAAGSSKRLPRNNRA